MGFASFRLCSFRMMGDTLVECCPAESNRKDTPCRATALTAAEFLDVLEPAAAGFRCGPSKNMCFLNPWKSKIEA